MLTIILNKHFGGWGELRPNHILTTKPYLKTTYVLQSIFPFCVIYCVYSLVLINKLNNFKILIAHMDAIIMSLFTIMYTYTQQLLTHYKIRYYYVVTLYCEQLWHLPIILTEYTGTDNSLWCCFNPFCLAYNLKFNAFYYCIEVRAKYITILLMNLKLRGVCPMIYTHVYEGMVVIVHCYTIKQDPPLRFSLSLARTSKNWFSKQSKCFGPISLLQTWLSTLACCVVIRWWRFKKLK